jgi:hypothetical protein
MILCVRDKNHDPVLILGARIDVMHAVSVARLRTTSSIVALRSCRPRARALPRHVLAVVHCVIVVSRA